MRVAILTLGCRVNQSESAVLEASLKNAGANIVSLKENPDYCVINTCTVTARSDYTSRQMIRRASRAGAKVIVTGCYAQLREEEAAGLPGVTRLVDNRDKESILGMLMGGENRPVFACGDTARPNLKIQDGCDYRCAYCAVPLARGRSRSIPAESVVERVEEMAERGYHEVVLTGIHLGSYGRDLSPEGTLSGLIGRLLSETRVSRIRLSSIEVNEIDDALIEMLQGGRLCRHLHLPLQSGSSRILRKMGRQYDLALYRRRVDLVSRIPGLALGTDLIAGFPGETEADFGQTLQAIRAMPFTYVHCFPFSPRPGTAAFSMSGRIAPEIVRSRVDVLLEVGRAKKEAFLSDQSLAVHHVVIENHDNGVMTGTTENYLRFRLEGHSLRRGSLVVARAARRDRESLEGFLIP